MIALLLLGNALADEPIDPAVYVPPPVYAVPVLPLVTAEGLPLPDPLDPRWRAELVTAEGLPLPDFERHGEVKDRRPDAGRILGVAATAVTIAAVIVPIYAVAVDSANP